MNRSLCFLVFVAGCGSVSGPVLPDAEIVTLTSVEVTPTTLMATRGLDAATQLKLTAHLSNSKDVDVTGNGAWESSAPTVVAISPEGLATPLAAGSSTITGSYEGKSGSMTVTVRSPQMFVVEEGSANLGVLVFDPAQSGNSPPVRQIKGPTAAFSFPWSVEVVQDEIYVSNVTSNSIAVYPVTASGDVAATRRIVGGTTGLVSPYGMTIHGDEIIAGSTGKVLVFPRTATGDTAPIRTITGPTTMLSGIVTGVEVYNNEIYVVSNTSAILVFPLMANGDVAPTRVISGPHTLMGTIYSARVINGEIYATGSGIKVFPIDANGDVAPIRYLRGADTQAPNVIDAHRLGQELYFINDNVTSLLQVTPLTATEDQVPLRGLTGAMTLMQSPRAMTFY